MVDIWDTDFSFIIFSGETPLDIVNEHSSFVGRPPLPPKWAFAPWIDEIKGQERVLNTAKFLRENHIPSSVIWTEDWRGGEEKGLGVYTIGGWGKTYDKELYPDLEKLANDLHNMGFKFLAYFNTFIKEGSEEYEEANEKGYLVKVEDGEVFLSTAPEGNVGLLDLTNPEAREWMKNIMWKVADFGFDGWMADFGEWLPYNALMWDGSSGAQAHNEYPVLWHRLNREFWDEYSSKKGKPGDYVFFTRSGYTGTQGISPVVWPGDQNTDWTLADGLPSVIPAALSIGICGVAIWGSDIAGYTGLPIMPTSTKELYIRWTELGAFSPVMRTHHGVMVEDNWRFNKDKETIKLFKKYAQIHAKLFPYIYTFANQSTSTGYPIMRHLYLQFPEESLKILNSDDANILDYQYMFGDSILVAPIYEEGATSRKIFLPKGTWFDFFTGEKYGGNSIVEVQAPLDKIPAFIKERSIIPMLSEAPDTFVGGLTATGIKILREDRLEVILAGKGNSSLTLYDGTTFEVSWGEACTNQLTVADRTENSLTTCETTANDVCIQTPAGIVNIKIRGNSKKVKFTIYW
jgi:alpha-glucosidase (family GH31 glycosyl hydrolase)